MENNKKNDEQGKSLKANKYDKHPAIAFVEENDLCPEKTPDVDDRQKYSLIK